MNLANNPPRLEEEYNLCQGIEKTKYTCEDLNREVENRKNWSIPKVLKYPNQPRRCEIRTPYSIDMYIEYDLPFSRNNMIQYVVCIMNVCILV